MVVIRPYKSDKQRKKERERRLKSKTAHYDPFKKKRKYKRRRSSNDILLDKLCGFIAASIGVLLLPLGFFHYGYKSAKRTRNKRIHKKNTAVGMRKSHRNPSQELTITTTTSIKQTNDKQFSKSNPTKSTPVTVHTKVEDGNKTNIAYTQNTPLFERKVVVTHPLPSQPEEPDENTPKSTPKNENDRYIRKRMIIAGSSYCDKSILEKLSVGTYFELSREPDNQYDENAVKLTYNGEKIGYIPKQDRLAFSFSLKLNKNIYGVITAINNYENPKKYEFETWFDSESI
jgi:hypothetical protein